MLRHNLACPPFISKPPSPLIVMITKSAKRNGPFLHCYQQPMCTIAATPLNLILSHNQRIVDPLNLCHPLQVLSIHSKGHLQSAPYHPPFLHPRRSQLHPPPPPSAAIASPPNPRTASATSPHTTTQRTRNRNRTSSTNPNHQNPPESSSALAVLAHPTITPSAFHLLPGRFRRSRRGWGVEG